MTVFCTYCGSDFARTEHLERHILIHSDLRPFRCEHCYLSFRRRDLLQRHCRTTHEDKGVDGVRSANRSPHACTNCVKNKTKCDREMPCTRCTKRGWTCTLRPRRQSAAAARRRQAALSLDGEGEGEGEGAGAGASASTGLRLPDGPPAPSAAAATSAALPEAIPAPRELGSRRRGVNDGDGGDGDDSHNNAGNDIDDGRAGAMSSGSHTVSHDSSSSPSSMELETEVETGMETEAEAETETETDWGMLLPAGHDFPLFTPPNDLSPGLSSNAFSWAALPSPSDFSTSFDTLPDLSVLSSTWLGLGLDLDLDLDLDPGLDLDLDLDLDLEPGAGIAVDVAPGAHSPQPSPADPVRFVVDAVASDDRDRLMLVMQCVLLKGQGIPLTLPAPDVLHSFLNTYTQADARGISLMPGRSLNVARQLQTGDGTTAGLSVLLAVAKGAELSDSPYAYHLFTTLLQSFVSALPSVIQQTTMRWEPQCLYTMLLLQQMAAWSGDQQSVKVGLDIWSDGIKLLQATKTLDYRPLDLSPAADKDSSFRLWQQRESQNRLLCAWALNDLEMSLLHDAFPKLSLKYIYAAVPESDLLWRADSADEWLSAYHHVYGDRPFDDRAYPQPLSHIFQTFLRRGHLPDDLPQYSIIELGLLLHPLSTLSFHLAQSFDYISSASDADSSTIYSRNETLLHRWLRCYRRSLRPSSFEKPSAVKYLVLYHVIALNSYTRLAEIERMLWRGCYPRGTDSLNVYFTHTYKGDIPLILLHCGRTLRLIRGFEYDQRPDWWCTAVYRIALILCACALVYGSPRSPFQPSKDGATSLTSPPAIAIDDPMLDDAQPLDLFGPYGMKTPALTHNSKGVLLLDSLHSVLDHLIFLVEDMDPHLRRSQLIVTKLKALKQLWEGCSPSE